MKKLLLVICLLPGFLYGQSPGGIGAGLQWWLKANAGALNNSLTPASSGDAIQQWNDQSLVGNNATQLTLINQPVFQSNIINGYPVFRFSGDQFLDATSAPNITGNFFFYIVFKQTAFTAGATNDGAGTYILDRTSATTDLTSFKIVNTDKYFLQQRDGAGNLGGPISTVSANTSAFVLADFFRTVGTGYGLFINGGNGITSGDNGALTGPILRVGRHATASNGGLTGDFAEIAVYNASISTANRRRIESYLALKYGITLDQTVATNYVSSTGATIFPATTSHDLFDKDIAGIGVDNNSGLSQSASQSQNPSSIVRISAPSPALVNGDFLVWGHNSTSIANSSNTPGGFSNRFSRVWRVAKTAFAGGTVTVSFDLGNLGIDMSDATKFALLIDPDGNFSNATAYTGGRTIAGNTVSFTTANLANNNYFTLASPLIPGPGGVGGALVWLRADKSVFIDAGTTPATLNNQGIQQWSNQGVAAYNASQPVPASQPTYQLAVANNNPVLRFASSASDTYLDVGPMGIGQTSDLEYAVVVSPSNTANAGDLSDDLGTYILDRTDASPSDLPLASLKLVTPGLFGYQERNDANNSLGGVTTLSAVSTSGPQIVGYYRSYNLQYGIGYNGAVENTLDETDGPMTLPNLRIGARRIAGNTGLDGDIAEVIFYDRTLSTFERNKLNSYLAVKYGITLDQTTATDYLNSNGTVVYPVTTTHGSSNADIAGIGQDPVSNLLQINSQSVNVNSIVRMNNPADLDDYEFLIWGSDGGSITNPNTTDVGAPLIRRLSRVWQVAETAGNVGTVDIVLDLSAVPGPKIQADLRLLIDRDGDGFADNDVAPQSGTLAGQFFTVTGIDFQHGDFFTVGSTNMTTPLPITLSSFIVENRSNTAVARWVTETEINNDFFTLQRSKDGVEFEAVRTVKGAGNTSARHDYSATDLHPYPGLSYYRLRQTDFDGTSTFSMIRPVNISAPEVTSLLVYPNPAEGTGFNINYESLSYGEALVEIMTVTGQQLHSEVRQMAPGVNRMSVTPLQPLAAGIYIIRVRSAEGALAERLAVK